MSKIAFALPLWFLMLPEKAPGPADPLPGNASLVAGLSQGVAGPAARIGRPVIPVTSIRCQ